MARIPPAPQYPSFPWRDFIRIILGIAAVAVFTVLGIFAIAGPKLSRAASAKTELILQPAVLQRKPELLMTTIGPEVGKVSKDGTTFTLVSDLHGAHTWADIILPTSDFLIIAGDIELSDPEDITQFEAWLGGLPHKHKVVVYGNMDKLGQVGEGCRRLRNAQVLCNEVAEVGGWRFFGAPNTPPFYGAFQFRSEADAAAHWGKHLKPNTEVDIIVTHGPPFGVGDTARGKHVGDKALAAAAKALEKPPQMWVCGHIHEGAGQHAFPHPKGDVLLINSAIATLHRGTGNPDAAPRTVELPGRHVTLSEQPKITRRLQGTSMASCGGDAAHRGSAHTPGCTGM